MQIFALKMNIDSYSRTSRIERFEYVDEMDEFETFVILAKLVLPVISGEFYSDQFRDCGNHITSLVKNGLLHN